MSFALASAAFHAVAPCDARARVSGRCVVAPRNERNNNRNNNASPPQAGD